MQGLPYAYAWQDLKDLFKPIGGVLQADIVMGQDGRSRGWGTVNFETQANADKAIKVLPQALGGLSLHLSTYLCVCVPVLVCLSACTVYIVCHDEHIAVLMLCCEQS